MVKSEYCSPQHCAANAFDPSDEIAAALRPNSPNPFNPATTIQYWIPRPADECIALYNIQGQRYGATGLFPEQSTGSNVK